MERSKYSLSLREGSFKDNMYKSTFCHCCYLNTFTSCRKQKTDSGESSNVYLSDYTSVDADGNLLLSLSYPKSPAFKIKDLNDVCLETVLNKINYKNYMQYCRKQYKKHARRITEEVEAEEDNYLPDFLINLCNMDDPDPYFDCNYDWYYSGGVLDTISIDNDEYLLSVLSNNLCLRNLSKGKVQQEFVMPSERIYNVKSSLYDNINFLAVRSKNKLQLYHVNSETEELTLNINWETQDESIPYTDCKLYNKTKMGFINTQNYFKSIDLKSENVLFEYKVTDDSDDLNNCCLFESHIDRNLIFLDKKNMKSFDPRSSESSHLLSLESFPLNICERLCCFFISKENPSYIFACTNHSIAKVDIRQQKAVKRWCHMMSSAPIICDSIQNGNEYICVSGFNDRILLKSTPEESGFPRTVPNPVETFNVLNLRKVVIQEGLEERLKSMINGLRLVKSDNNLSLYYSNSFGDIFCNDITVQSLYQRSVDNEPAIRYMKKWIKKLVKKAEPKVLYATEIAEMSAVKELHCKGILHDNLMKYTDDTPVDLKLDIDPYVYDMSVIWGDKPENIKLPDEPSSVNKVAEWLNRDITD